MYLKENIVHLREIHNLRQVDLVHLFNEKKQLSTLLETDIDLKSYEIIRNTLVRIESGKMYPDIRFVAIVSELFNISMYDLLFVNLSKENLNKLDEKFNFDSKSELNFFQNEKGILLFSKDQLLAYSKIVSSLKSKLNDFKDSHITPKYIAFKTPKCKHIASIYKGRYSTLKLIFNLKYSEEFTCDDEVIKISMWGKDNFGIEFKYNEMYNENKINLAIDWLLKSYNCTHPDRLII